MKRLIQDMEVGINNEHKNSKLVEKVMNELDFKYIKPVIDERILLHFSKTYERICSGDKEVCLSKVKIFTDQI